MFINYFSSMCKLVNQIPYYYLHDNSFFDLLSIKVNFNNPYQNIIGN